MAPHATCLPTHATGHYHIYFDNFFTGVELEQCLPADGIYSCGTTCSNRKNISDDLRSEMKKVLKERGDHMIRQDGHLVFTKWQDAKVVTMQQHTIKFYEGRMGHKYMYSPQMP